jgi:hypothetical protein
MPDLDDPFGEVDDIMFNLIPSDKNLATSVTDDQDFFQLNLTQLNPTPDIIPDLYKVFGGPGSFLTIQDPGGTTMTTDFSATGAFDGGPTIVPSEVPEPGSASLLAIAAVGILDRRRRRR